MARRGCVYRRDARSLWQVKLTVAGRPRYRGGFSSKAMAEAWLASEILRVERAEVLGIAPVPEDVTFARFLPRWRRHLEPLQSPTTHANAVLLAERVFAPAFGTKMLSRIGRGDIEEFLARRQSEAGVSPATRNRYMTILSSIFRLAVDLGLARENPVRGVRRGREHERPMLYLSAEDEARLFAALPGWLRAPALVALDAGLRAGEVGALLRRDVDLERVVLLVRRSKNRRPREVGLTRRLAAALEEHLRTHPARQEVLFLRPGDGRPLSGQVYRGAFDTAVRRAGLGGGEHGMKFRFHDLRHMYGVRLAEGGATPAEIKAALGHRCLAATMRYLDHAPRDAARTVARLLDARLERQAARPAPAPPQPAPESASHA